MRAGADVMVALTYYAHRSKLRVVGRERDVELLNRQALRIAREAAAEGNALVAGDLCNTWEYNLDDIHGSSRVVRDMYEEQVRWAVEEGVDFIIAETLEYVGEALIANDVIKRHGLASLVTFGATYEKSKDGYDWIDGCRMLKENGEDNLFLEIAKQDLFFSDVADVLAGSIRAENFIGRAPEQTLDFLKDDVQPVLDKFKDQLEGPSELRV